MTKNAVLVDTTKLTIKQMEAKLINLVKNSIKKNMEIYKDLSSPASQQFEKLLNSQLSKNKIEEGKIIEGKIYGRGSTDMKCGTSASIWTYIILNKFKTKFSGKLTLTCVSDEETFGPWGSRWLIDNEPEVLGDCCLNGEPSSPFTIRYGEKGLLWLTFKVRTDGSHGAYTHLSKSATLVATDIIQELKSLEALDVEVPHELRKEQEKSATAF